LHLSSKALLDTNVKSDPVPRDKTMILLAAADADALSPSASSFATKRGAATFNPRMLGSETK